jgi:hypothetical protein
MYIYATNVVGIIGERYESIDQNKIWDQGRH